MNIILSLVGIVGLSFRLWLINYLRKDLKVQVSYVSQFLNAYAWIELILNFSFNPISMVLLCGLPGVIMSLYSDAQLLRIFLKRNTKARPNYYLLIIDKFTLHLPIFLVELSICIIGPQYVIPHPTFLSYLIGNALLFVPFFLIDKRWTEKYHWPIAIRLLYVFVPSSIGAAVFLFLIYPIAYF